MIIGNCNLTEKMTGYFIRYGDSGSDVDPIAGLYKTQVLQLARHVGFQKKSSHRRLPLTWHRASRMSLSCR